MLKVTGELEVLLRTTDPYEAEHLRSCLLEQGIDAVLHGGSQASLFGGAQALVEQQVLVPTAQLERARAFLQSTPVLDGTAATGEALGDAVCAVHEEKAVATCSRCGNFLCTRCGSLGEPPVCESCVGTPEASRPKPVVLTALAGVWAAVWVGSVVLGLLGGLVWLAVNVKR